MFGNAVEMDRHQFTDSTVTNQQNAINKMISNIDGFNDVTSKNINGDCYDNATSGGYVSYRDIPSTEVTEFPIISYVLQNYETDDRRTPTKLNRF